MALSTARMHKVRGRPPLLAAGITSVIHSHSSSVRSLGYVFSFIYPFYTTHEDFSDRLSGVHGNDTLRAPRFTSLPPHGENDPSHGQPRERALPHLHGGRKGAFEDQGTEWHFRGELERHRGAKRLPKKHHIVWSDALVCGQPVVRCSCVAIHTRLIGLPGAPSVPAIVEHKD